MRFRPEKIEPPLAKLTAVLAQLTPSLPAGRRPAIERWRGDAEALRFHVVGRQGKRPPVVVLLGGTGTGKSTVTNRLLGQTVTAASFRRTYTAGPVAIVGKPDDLPDGWLSLETETVSPAQTPARGVVGKLAIVTREKRDITDFPTIIDTPDLDGDQPAHHAQADRAFRWAEAVVFLVTPEKYQMTELLPYYRLARRYGVPCLFVMNKCEEQAVLDDYARQLESGTLSGAGDEETSEPATKPSVFAVARDDAGYVPPVDSNLDALRAAIVKGSVVAEATRPLGLFNRTSDVLARLEDQVLSPLREDRKEADRLIAALRAMETPAAEVELNPLTQQLQRRLRQRSILYLMGPQRILDRVRQAPTLLARLPRFAWDYLSKGEVTNEFSNALSAQQQNELPDFKLTLIDQFAVLQSRIDDVLRGTPTGTQWADAQTTGEHSYAAARLDPTEAGKIADEEIGELRRWLEQKWNATPRDTRMIESLLKYLPGGKKLSRWTEAAPYLLTVALVTHGAFFGHLDLMILGGYSVFAWMSERLSNEVTSRTRAANVKIESRFSKLAHDQIDRVCRWIDQQAPSARVIAEIEKLAANLSLQVERE